MSLYNQVGTVSAADGMTNSAWDKPLTINNTDVYWVERDVNDVVHSTVTNEPRWFSKECGLLVIPTRVVEDRVYFAKFGKEWYIHRSDLADNPRATVQWLESYSIGGTAILGVTSLWDAIEIAASSSSYPEVTAKIMNQLAAERFYDPCKYADLNRRDIFNTLKEAQLPVR